MSDVWGSEAREAVARALHDCPCGMEYGDRDIEQADAVLAALTAHAVPRTAIEARIAELDLRADQDEPWPWGDRDPTLEARAAELRALAGGDQ